MVITDVQKLLKKGRPGAVHGHKERNLLINTIITAPDTPVPYSPPLEEFFLPNPEKVCRAARALVAY